MIRPDWIAVDWGTSSLRAWAMTDDGQGLAMLCSDQGMGVLTPDQFEGALFDLIGDWSIDSHTPVIACGMVGAKQGWIEAPYDTTPCKPQASMIAAPTQGDALNVQIIAGICQAKPADVMRGEETQIAGFLRLNPKWDGVVCLPGTHTKWVHVSAGEVVSFQTFMTGEMFALLSNQSVLRHSVQSDDWDQTAFDTATDEAMSRPEATAARLFSLRASDLLDGTSSATSKSRLSGLLIGAELAAARPYWLGQQVALIGTEPFCDAYASALLAQGVPVIRTDATQMTLTGLKAAYANFKEHP